MNDGKCCWVIQPNPNAKYCLKPTKYKVVKDDDENKVRKYDPFCPEHRAIVDDEVACDKCGGELIVANDGGQVCEACYWRPKNDE